MVPRLGDALVEEGLVTPEQLADALAMQDRYRKTGEAPLLGHLLIQMGAIDKPTLDRAITAQILKLQTALQQSNQTLEKRVEERTAELEKAYQKLSELSKLKANFISNISHELRTPMTHVKGYVDLLLNDDFGKLNPDQKQAIEVLKKASERLGRLIDDLILFSTAETSTIQIKYQVFDLRALAERVVKSQHKAATAKKIHLWLDDDQDQNLVSADPERIEWVVNQLVENAIKYTNPEGDILVRIKEKEESVCLAVIDSGIGIPSDRLDEIFEPFHQLDGSSTRKQGGTGLGLTLAKKIIEAHDIKLAVASVPGKGSKFEFQLPKRSA